MMRLFAMIAAVLVNCVMGSVFAAVVGVDPMVGAVGMNVVAATVGYGVVERQRRDGRHLRLVAYTHPRQRGLRPVHVLSSALVFLREAYDGG